MTLDPPTTSDRARRGLALLVMAAGLAGLVAGAAALSTVLPSPAAGAAKDPGAGSPVLSAVTLGILLLLCGFAPAWASGQLLKRPGLAMLLPVWSVALGLACGWLVQTGGSLLAGPDADLGGKDFALDVAVCCCIVLVLTLGSTLMAAAFTLSWRTAARCALPLLLIGAPWIALGWAAILYMPDMGEAGRLVRPEPWAGKAVLLLMVFAVGINGAAIGHFLRMPTARRAMAAASMICVFAAAGWFLLDLIAAPDATPDAGRQEGWSSAALVFLGLDADPASAVGDRVIQWCAAYLAAALVLGWGQWSGLLLSGYETATAGAGRLAAVRRQATARPRGWLVPAGRAYLLLAVAYAVFAVYGSLVPLDYAPKPLSEALDVFLKTPYFVLHIENRSDLVANLLLFIPLTFFAMGAWTRENTRPGRALKALCTLAAAGVLAVAVEFAQVFFPPRTVSLNDILAACVGGIVGVAAWLAFGDSVTHWVRHLWRERNARRLAVHILRGYVVALVLNQLFPFDITITWDELLTQFDEGRVVLVPFADWGRMSLPTVAARVAMLVPVGYLAALLDRRRRPIRAALLVGGGIVLAIELFHVFLYSRPASTTEAIIATAGAVLGGWLATRFGPAAEYPLPQGPVWAALSWIARLAAACSGVVAVFWLKWRPLEFQWPPQGLTEGVAAWIHIPFYHQYWNTEFQATQQVIQDFAAPLVLGLMWMSVMRRWGPWGRVIAAAVAAGAGAAGEAGQMFFPPHTPDITTVFIAAAGGVLGTFLHDPFVRIFIRGPARDGDPAVPLSDPT